MMEHTNLEARIGEIVAEIRFPIEAGKIAEFARAMHDNSAFYFDERAAIAAGFSAIPAPLTFSVASAHHSGGDATALPSRLGLDLARLLHGEERWTFHRPVVAGDVLHGLTRIAHVDRKPKGASEMLRVTLQTDFHDASGALVLSEFAVLIELPEC